MPKIYRQKSVKNVFAFLLFISSLIQSPTILAAPGREGPYVGAYFGGGFGNNDASTKAGDATSTSYFGTLADIEAVNNAGSWSDNPDTVIGGIQLGHDWVWKQMVYGLVLDFGSLTLDSTEKVSENYPGSADTFFIKTSMNTDWLFTLRGRLGYQTKWRWPSFLYVTGGMAMTNVEVKNEFSDNSSLVGLGEESNAQNQIGWTAGLGIEVASFKYASVGLEYLFVQVPSVEAASTVTNSQGGFGIPPNSLTSELTTTGKFQANLLKVVVNYQFAE